MQRLWYQLGLSWNGLRRLSFLAQRTQVTWLGVLLATMVLLGGLALVLRTPPPSGQVQASPGEGGGARAPTTLPGTPPGGGQRGPGQPDGGMPGGGAAGDGQPGNGGQPGGGAGPGDQPVTTPPDAPVTTAPGGAPPTTAPGGGGEPTTTQQGGTTTTCTTNPEVTLLPPVTVSVSLTLPLPLLGELSEGDTPAARPLGGCS